MLRRWDHRTRKSPFRENLANSDEKRAELLAKTTAEFEEDEFKRKVIDNMTGKPNFEICPKSRIPQYENLEHQIALEYRLQVRDSKVINKEKQFVDQMVEKELQALQTKFPKIADKLSFKSSQNSQNRRDSNSTRSEYLESIADPFRGNEFDYSNENDDIFDIAAEENSSIGSNSAAGYIQRINSRPLTSLKTSAEEIDLEFSKSAVFGNHNDTNKKSIHLNNHQY